MNLQGMLRWSLVFLLALVMIAVTAPYAFGCTPDEDGRGRCVLERSRPATNAAPSQVAQAAPVAAAPVPRPTPDGLSPQSSRLPMYVKPEYCIEAMCPGAVNAPPINAPGGWDMIPARSTLWYHINDGHGLQVLIWIFANGQGGLALDVYAPDQHDLSGNPIGRGSRNPNYQGSDLFYSGRTMAYGTWYAKLTNNNSIPVAFSMRFTVTTPSLGNSCDNCHKAIGYEWNGCTDPAFCGKLHDYWETEPQCYSHDIEADLAGKCK